MHRDTRHVAVVYDENSITPMDLAAAARGTCRIVWVVDTSDEAITGLLPLLRRLGEVVDAQNADPAAVAAELQPYQPGGILTLAEAQMPLTAALAERLDLPYHPARTAERLADKYAQREALRVAGVATPKIWRLPERSAHSADIVADPAHAGIRFPVVIKPRRGTNSIATARAESAEQLRDVLRRIGEVPGGMLIEEYFADSDAPGPFADDLAVELLVQHGRVIRLATTGKFRLAAPFRGRGCFLPSHLAPPAATLAYAAAETAIRALGITDGFVNVDVKMTPAGPRVVEVNGRIGGNVPELVELAGGPPLLPLIFRLALGEDLTEDPAIRRIHDGSWERIGYFAWVQAPLAARRLTAVGGLDDVANLPHVSSVTLNRSPGGSLDWTIGAQSHVCAVYGAVTTHDELASAREHIDQLVAIEFDE